MRDNLNRASTYSFHSFCGDLLFTLQAHNTINLCLLVGMEKFIWLKFPDTYWPNIIATLTTGILSCPCKMSDQCNPRYWNFSFNDRWNWGVTSDILWGCSKKEMFNRFICSSDNFSSAVLATMSGISSLGTRPLNRCKYKKKTSFADAYNSLPNTFHC